MPSVEELLSVAEADADTRSVMDSRIEIDAESEQLEAYTMFNYPVSMEKGWEYVKQQIGDTRKYVYDMDTKLTETEASTLEAKIDTAILSEMIGG